MSWYCRSSSCTRAWPSGRSCRARYASISRCLITQSTSRSSFSGSFSIVRDQCSHISSAFSSSGGSLGVGVAQRTVEVLALDVERADLAAVRQAHPAPAGDVVADLADRTDRVLQRHVAQHHARVLEHAQHAGGADLQEGGVLAHVRVAHDHVQAPVPLGVGVRFVAGVDDRAAARGGDETPSQMCSARWAMQNSAPRAVCSTLPAPA
jgi:hypothetical protein